MPFALSHPRLGHQVCVRLQLAFNLPVHRPPRLRSTQPAPLAPSIRRPRRPTASPGPQSPRLPPFGLILRPIQPPKVLVFWPSQVPKILEAEGEEEEREKKKVVGYFTAMTTLIQHHQLNLSSVSVSFPNSPSLCLPLNKPLDKFSRTPPLQNGYFSISSTLSTLSGCSKNR